MKTSNRLDEFKKTFESGAPPYNAPHARYVIDTQGIIRAADVNADYTILPEPSETLRHLGTLII